MINRQKGVALIIVMLVVVVIITVSASMGYRLQVGVKRASNLKTINQAYWYGVSAEVFVKKLLLETLRDEEKFNLSQPWATPDMTFPVDNGTIGGNIKDLQACFNLNALLTDEKEKDKPSIKALQRLFNLLELDSLDAETIAESVADWLDTDDFLRSSYGAEDSDYESLAHPHETGKSLFANVSELRVIKGVTPKIYNQVKDYLCVIPGVSELKLNVNTLDPEKPEILAAVLGARIDADLAKDILSERPEEGYGSIEDFWQSSSLQTVTGLNDKIKAQFGVETEYFYLAAETTFGETGFKLNSVIRLINGQQAITIDREIGGAL